MGVKDNEFFMGRLELNICWFVKYLKMLYACFNGLRCGHLSSISISCAYLVHSTVDDCVLSLSKAKLLH